MASATNAMIGTYQLVRRLGVGGMGEVWLARQRGAAGFARDVAIKRLLPQAMEQPDVVAMFIEEAQITGRLRHPNVVNVIELGAAESGELYLVLEHVDGTGLHKLLRDASTRPSSAGALAIGRDVALALHAAHTLADDDGKDLGLVHRDVTPSNVMMDKYGHVKLMDFGIAKVRAKSNQTEAGIIKGKIAYLAPEQLRGSVDPRSDLFSLGLLVWEIIAGQQARSGSTDAVMMAKVALDSIPSIRKAVPDLPDAIANVVDKSCALDPDDRYQTGEEMAQAMLAALQTLPERNNMELAREEIATLVKLAVKREGDAVSGTTNASRTVDADRPIALTLHSLVVQQGDQTISRSLSPDMIKVRPPTDARTMSGGETGTRRHGGKRRKRSSALPLVALVGTAGVIAAAFALRSKERPRVEPERPVAGVVTPPAVEDAAVRVAVVTTDAAVAAIGLNPPGTPTVSDGGATVAVRTTPVGRPPRNSGTGNSHAVPVVQLPDGVTPTTPASLGVIARPWAMVTIDGRDYGQTPVARISLPPGSHNIVLANAERQVSRRLRIQLGPGERRVINEDLTRGE